MCETAPTPRKPDDDAEPHDKLQKLGDGVGSPQGAHLTTERASFGMLYSRRRGVGGGAQEAVDAGPLRALWRGGKGRGG